MINLQQYVPQQKYLESNYLKALCKMLPTGSIWETVLLSLDSVPENPSDRNTFVTLLSCFAKELERFDMRANDLMKELVPGLATELLPEFEKLAGIDPTGLTIEQRRGLAHAKLFLNSGVGLSVPFYLEYADLLGYAIRILEFQSDYRPFYVAPVGVDSYGIGSRIGDRLNHAGMNSVVTIQVIGGLEGSEPLQREFAILKPGHVYIVWEGLIFNRTIIYNFDYYTFADIGIGNLTDETATDSATYAEDHANLLAQYGIKELTQIYLDDYEGKRPTNVAYSWGPHDLAGGSPNFDNVWAIFSKMTEEGGVFAYNINTATEYDLSSIYIEYSSEFAGAHGIISGHFDMSGTPVLALEYDVSTIAVWRAIEGITYWEGYSPLVICNAAYTQEDNIDELDFDAVILYLEDLGGYTSEWNYDSVYRAADQIEFDTRYSRTIKMRFQRNNFEIAYTVCTTDFDIAYIENAWFSGDPDAFVIPDDIGREYVLYISVRDTDKVRHTLKSAPYYVYNYYDLPVDEEVGMTATFSSGAIEEAILTTDAITETAGMSASFHSGACVNLESKYDGTEDPELIGMTATFNSGSIETVVQTPAMQTETAGMSAAFNSGSNAEVVVSDSMNTETAGMSASFFSGSIVTE